jgi:hypothetical protein
MLFLLGVRKMKKLMVIFLVLAMSMPAMALNAEYYAHEGDMSVSGAASIADAVAGPGGGFIQMAPGSWIVLRFPDGQAAVPDGTSAADLQVVVYDEAFPADAEVLVSSDGVEWTSFGVYGDTANIDLDLKGSRVAMYVKVDQGDHYIDPNYPQSGFDLDAVVALNSEVVCIAIKDQILTYSDGYYLEGEVIPGEYDVYGYNYHTHMFNGTYFNSYANGAGFSSYDGDDEAYLVENPAAASHWAWPHRNVDLIMKWNDAWLSNNDCDNDGLLDRHLGFDTYIGSGAWLTNLQSGSYIGDDDEEIHWNYFCKIIAAPADAYVEDGVWYTADGEEIGAVIWGEFAITQEVSNDAGLEENGQLYLSPTYPGLGNQTSEVTATKAGSEE